MINLRVERINRGLSQREAARQMGLDFRALQRAEAGDATPQPRNAKKIADFYGYKVTDIWPMPEPEEALA